MLSLIRKKLDKSQTGEGTERIKTNQKGKFKQFFRNWTKKKTVLSLILVIVIIAGSIFAPKFFGKKANSGAVLTAEAAVGSVSSVIEGSGTIEALQQYEITSLKKGEIEADYFEEGDIVEKGATLYQMDNDAGNDSVQNSKSSLEKSKSSTKSASDSIQSANESIAKAQRNLNTAQSDVEKLNVKSKNSGIITSMNVSVGDNVNENAKIAEITDSTSMILEIQFLSQYTSNMTANSSNAEVTLSKNGYKLYGTVTKISSGSVLSLAGAKVTNVEITVENPGSIDSGDRATAEVMGYACSSEGTFKYTSKTIVYSEVSGKVEKVNKIVGDKVSAGQTVVVLSNSKLNDAVTSARDSLNDAKREATSKQRSYSDAKLNLSDSERAYCDAVDSLGDYIVTAPIDGKIIQKNYKAGEKLDGTDSTVMAIIADLSSLVFEMSVDELDISSIEEGMGVNITLDAIENVTFKGTVTSKSIVGTSENGVTSYPVKVTFLPKEEQDEMATQKYDDLIPGMNVTANVVIQSVENVIVVPVSAVRRGNVVIVENSSTAKGVDMENHIPDSVKSSDASDSDDKKGKSETKSNTVNDESGSDSKSSSRLKNIIASLDIPDGYKAVVVETGLSDENFIEIKNGLNSGDVVLLPDTTAATQTSVQMQTGGMPGGMGGMGGMPGGMYGGNRQGGTNRSATGTTGMRSTGTGSTGMRSGSSNSSTK